MTFQVLTKAELCAHLGVPPGQEVKVAARTQVRQRSEMLIMSPSRSSSSATTERYPYNFKV